MKTPPCIGLVLAGGGARGAYQVGVLKAIAELWQEAASPFSIVTGVSVGAINAAALASCAGDFRTGMGWLEQLWLNLNAHHIYHTDATSILYHSMRRLLATAFGNIAGSPSNALLDTRPLEQLLEREINFARIGAALASGALDALAVTASSYADGRAKTFFQSRAESTGWSRARRDGLPAAIGVQHIMASSALPLIFHPRPINGEYFGDGALRLTAPVSPAIHLGAARVLVIGTRDERPDVAEAAAGPPNLGEISGYLLDVLFNDNLNADVERLRRINRTLALMSAEERRSTSLREIGVHVMRPSVDVRAIAGRHAGELPWTIRFLLRRIGAWGPNWRVASYFLFERSFCCALIDLGYRDAMAQRDELCSFLEICPP